MKNCIYLIWFNLKKIFSDYKKIAVIFLVPLVMLGGTAVVFNKDNNIDSPTAKIKLGIVDLEKSSTSSMLLGTITEEETLSNLMKFENMEESDAAEYLKNNKITAYIVIPENFSTGLLNMENPPLKLYSNGENMFEFLIVQKTVEGFSKYVNYVEICTSAEYYALRDMGMSQDDAIDVNENISYTLIFKTLGRKTFFETVPVYNFPSVSSFVYHGISILVLLLFFMATFSSMEVIEERDSNITVKIGMAGKSVFSYLFSKSLAYSIFNSFCMSVFILIFIRVSGIVLNLGEVVVFLLSTAFLLNSFWILTGVLIRDKNGFTSISSVFNVMIAFVGGSFFPVVLLPYSISRFAGFSPNLLLSKILVNMVYGNISMMENLVMVAGFLVSGLLMIILSSILVGRSEYK